MPASTDSVSLLTSVFGPSWTKEQLKVVLSYCGGDLKATIELILGHGENSPNDLVFHLQQSHIAELETELKGLKKGSYGTKDSDEKLKKKLALGETKKTHPGDSITLSVEEPPFPSDEEQHFRPPSPGRGERGESPEVLSQTRSTRSNQYESPCGELGVRNELVDVPEEAHGPAGAAEGDGSEQTIPIATAVKANDRCKWRLWVALIVALLTITGLVAGLLLRDRSEGNSKVSSAERSSDSLSDEVSTSSWGCEYSEKWSAWTVCSEPCGGGTQSRTRLVLTLPSDNIESCTKVEEAKQCNTEPCPVGCEVSSWSSWSRCSVECGGGTQTRNRTILKQPEYSSEACPELEQTQSCNNEPCPVDCEVSSWSSWSLCSEECGGGTQTQTRTILAPAQYNGEPCPELEQSQSCNTEPCAVDCEVTSWSSWSQCSVECGGGTQTRIRTILKQPQYSGEPCPELEQTQSCSTEPCAVDCEVSSWSSWSQCSEECDGGTQKRSREIEENPKHGGEPCPRLEESRECNTHCCPVDCRLSDWSEYSSCSDTCDGTETRRRYIKREAKCGGERCPDPEDLEQERECNEASSRMRFKSHPSINTLYGGLWLYAATSRDVRTDDASYTYWVQCGDALVSQSNNGLCLTRVYPGDNIDDYDVELENCRGGGDQRWRIESSGGYYKIKNRDQNCCIDVFSGDSSANRKDVDCISCNQGDGYDQYWDKF